MRKGLSFIVCVMVGAMTSWASPTQAKAPQSIVGIRLGSQIEELKDMVEIGAAVPLWGSQYLMRAPLRSARGYQSGYVVYGNCARKGRVVRIKLTYEDESLDFYNKLQSLLTRRYGKPSEWRGNPFGTLRIWKWSLRDPDGKRVSIILQHYVGDDDSFTPGNSIRLTHSSYIEEESACYQEKLKERKDETCPALMPPKVDMEWFLPQ
ncbi:MAG: hypothetical protein MUF52_03175 [Syntrophobacteraceae bacterium]|nr:hypothetical protein [Syntrophobacteraceae bacterium]